MLSYDRDISVRHLLGDAEHLAALEANRADLARHRYVGIGWKPGPLQVPRLAAIEATLDVEMLSAMPPRQSGGGGRCGAARRRAALCVTGRGRLLLMTLTEDENEPEGEEARFVRLALTVFDRARVWARAEELQTRSNQQFAFDDTTSWHYQAVTWQDYDRLLQGHVKEIAQLPETQECVRTLWSDGILRYLLPRDQRASSAESLTANQVQQLVWYVVYALVDVLQLSNTFQPAPAQILDTYFRFRAAWTATAHRHVYLVPLLNLQAQLSSPVSVGPRFQIARFTNEEKSWAWNVMNRSVAGVPLSFLTYIKTEFKLTGEQSFPDINKADDPLRLGAEFGRTHQEILFEMRGIVTALRLQKAGDVAITAYVDQSDEVPPESLFPTIGMPGWLWSDFQVRSHGSVYTLEEGDLAEVRTLVEALLPLDGRPHRAGLDVGLRRFNQSYSREYAEDRLIDLTIALESTLLSDVSDAKTDLKYRFALLGAALLAPHRDPHEVRTFLRSMYDARSAIVHSGKSLAEMKKKDLLGHEWHDYAQACEDMTREILPEYVRELASRPDRDVKSVTKGLESRVVGGLRQAKSG